MNFFRSNKFNFHYSSHCYIVDVDVPCNLTGINIDLKMTELEDFNITVSVLCFYFENYISPISHDHIDQGYVPVGYSENEDYILYMYWNSADLYYQIRTDCKY